MELDIRQETPEDYKDIRIVNVGAFAAEEGQGKALFVELLRRTERFIPELSLVARLDRKIAGHILFYPIDILKSGIKIEVLSLALLSVLPEFQNKSVGSGLVKTGLAKARTLGFQSVIVLGHKRYYPRFGFFPINTYGIKAPFEDPDSVFMAMELEPGALKNMAGTIHYPKEFDGI